MNFPGSSAGKESTCNVGDLGWDDPLVKGMATLLENTLQYSCLENPHGEKSLVGCRLWGCKESDTTE